jgi:NitT/TauT family transport system substrate-binding protein
MMMRSWRLAAVAGLLALALRSPAFAGEPFRVIVTDARTPLVPNSVMELADRLGYFARAGVKVDFVRVQQTPLAVAALRTGAGDMADISAEAALLVVARGHFPVKAVNSPDPALPYLIAARDGIRTLRDLRGKAFGIGRPGSLDDTMTVAVLRAKGVDPAAVKLVSIGQPADRARALAAGRIDATAVSVGTWTSLPDKSGLHVLVSPAAFHAAAPILSKVNVVTKATLKARRPDVVAVVRALIEASRDFAARPQLWVDAMETARPDVDPVDLATLAAAYRPIWGVRGGFDRATLAHTARWIYAHPQYRKVPRIALSDWTDLSVVRDALRQIDKAADEGWRPPPPRTAVPEATSARARPPG